MVSTSHSLESVPMRLPGKALTLKSSPIVPLGTDESIVDFQETRFRSHALRLQKTLKDLASALSAELGAPLTSVEDLRLKEEPDLKSGTYCVFDFLDVKTRHDRGFLRTKWIPYAVFVRGERIFSLHASYSDKGSFLSGITMRHDDKEEYTRCTTPKSALKVGRAYLQTYVVLGNL